MQWTLVNMQCCKYLVFCSVLGLRLLWQLETFIPARPQEWLRWGWGWKHGDGDEMEMGMDTNGDDGPNLKQYLKGG